MTLIQEIKSICQSYGFKPLRRRGQNFLINERVIKDLIKTANLSKKDLVLEIGAGIGTLTKEIVKKAKKVIAVEIDKKLVEVLKRQLKGIKNVKIIQDNILDLRLKFNQDYKIVASLPYNITGAVLRKFLSRRQKPKMMVLILQKEVAEKICVRSPKMNLLAVSVQFYSHPEIVKYIPSNNFWPRPKVDSAILKITKIKSDKDINEKKFFKVVRAGFSSPRKYLLNNLTFWNLIDKEKGKEIFKKIKLDLKVRAENLKINDWKKLISVLQSKNGKGKEK